MRQRVAAALSRIVVGVMVLICVGAASTLAMGLTFGMEMTVTSLSSVRDVALRLFAMALRWVTG
ncbi:MAG TPA: hypothetical protein VHT71_16660 [Methylomirabilota bacterium]|jgi:hypothetical protein|nr:hypothetical protein [Methylomirabilota bacterium]